MEEHVFCWLSAYGSHLLHNFKLKFAWKCGRTILLATVVKLLTKGLCSESSVQKLLMSTYRPYWQLWYVLKNLNVLSWIIKRFSVIETLFMAYLIQISLQISSISTKSIKSLSNRNFEVCPIPWTVTLTQYIISLKNCHHLPLPLNSYNVISDY